MSKYYNALVYWDIKKLMTLAGIEPRTSSALNFKLLCCFIISDNYKTSTTNYLCEINQIYDSQKLT